MGQAEDRLRDMEAADLAPAPVRLLRLRTRASRLQLSEAFWTVSEPLDALFDAAEALIKADPETAQTNASVREALDSLFVAMNLMLDGVE
jgi:hypothetical protein